jgi:LysR family transcriptional regulator, hca operon transcriptional activator
MIALPASGTDRLSVQINGSRVFDQIAGITGVAIAPAREADNLAMAISLVASTRGFALLPRYAQNFLPRSVVSRPIKGKTPTIDLVVGYHKANASPILKLFLSKLDELIRRVEQAAR